MSRKPCTHYVGYRNYGKRWEVDRVLTPKQYTRFFRDLAKRHPNIFQTRKITHTCRCEEQQRPCE